MSSDDEIYTQYESSSTISTSDDEGGFSQETNFYNSLINYRDLMKLFRKSEFVNQDGTVEKMFSEMRMLLEKILPFYEEYFNFRMHRVLGSFIKDMYEFHSQYNMMYTDEMVNYVKTYIIFNMAHVKNYQQLFKERFEKENEYIKMLLISEVIQYHNAVLDFVEPHMVFDEELVCEIQTMTNEFSENMLELDEYMDKNTYKLFGNFLQKCFKFHAYFHNFISFEKIRDVNTMFINKSLNRIKT